jgi:hypothetical protein
LPTILIVAGLILLGLGAAGKLAGNLVRLRTIVPLVLGLTLLQIGLTAASAQMREKRRSRNVLAASGRMTGNPRQGQGAGFRTGKTYAGKTDTQARHLGDRHQPRPRDRLGSALGTVA